MYMYMYTVRVIGLISIPHVLPLSLSLIHLQRPHPAAHEEMTRYHSDDYIRFLRTIRPDNVNEYTKQMQRCKSFIIVLHVALS